MLTLSGLESLLAVADTGSIASAARKLQYTAPAISQKVAKLERDVGATLLIRHRRGVSLTTAGELLAKRGRGILDEITRTQRDLARIKGALEGRVRIGAFTTAAIRFLPPVLTAFSAVHRYVDVELRDYEPPAGVAALESGSVDVILTHHYEHGPSPDAMNSLHFELKHEEELVLVSAPEAIVPDDLDQSWATIARQPLISGSYGLANRVALESFFAAMDLPAPNVAFETANYDVTCALVSSGMAIALVPASVAQTSFNPLAVRRAPMPRLHRSIVVGTRKDSTNPALPAFLRFLNDGFTRYVQGLL